MKQIKKVVIVGDGYCGKTSLLHVFCRDERVQEYQPTIFDTFAKQVKFKGVNRYLAIWDTSGQEEWEAIRRLTYPDTDIVIVLFDITSRNSLSNVATVWEPEVRKFTPKNTPIVLVGNKIDLRVSGSRNQVSEEEALHMSRLIDAKAYREVSAMTNEGVEDMFLQVVKLLYKNDSICRIL